MRRGFSYDGKLSVILDGAKGLRKAVYETFGNDIELLRCQWHKWENVVGHLKKKMRQHSSKCDCKPRGRKKRTQKPIPHCTRSMQS